MNQYRCETCNHYTEGKDCMQLSHWLLVTEYQFTEELGCASHSDFNPQAERDKVLDELGLIIPLCDALIEKFDCQSQLGFNALLIKKKYEELRQGKDGE
jgi:hypothetical protein